MNTNEKHIVDYFIELSREYQGLMIGEEYTAYFSEEELVAAARYAQENSTETYSGTEYATFDTFLAGVKFARETTQK